MRRSHFYGLFLSLCVLAALSFAVAQPEARESDELGEFIDWLIADKDRLEDVRFSELVMAVSGTEVLSVDRDNPTDRELLLLLEETLDQMLVALNDEAHQVHRVGRVNEVSRHVEDFLSSELTKVHGIKCEVPMNASNELQRSGYPDLRLEHEETGRIFYLDPKVLKEGSENSSFRTFYFEPKRDTNKILDDASHIIVGLTHAGKVDGKWRFKSWKLVDLIDFRVRLKAEFQASNRDLYRDASIISESASKAAEE